MPTTWKKKTKASRFEIRRQSCLGQVPVQVQRSESSNPNDNSRELRGGEVNWGLLLGKANNNALHTILRG